MHATSGWLWYSVTIKHKSLKKIFFFWSYFLYHMLKFSRWFVDFHLFSYFFNISRNLYLPFFLFIKCLRDLVNKFIFEVFDWYVVARGATKIRCTPKMISFAYFKRLFSKTDRNAIWTYTKTLRLNKQQSRCRLFFPLYLFGNFIICFLFIFIIE